MTEQYPTDADLNALSGTYDAEQEIPFPAIGESPYYTAFYKMLYRLLKVARRAGDLRVFKDGDLTFGVRAGKFFNGDSTIDFSQVTSQPLTNNATNYIYITADGTLTVNTTGFPDPSDTPHIPLATITTSAGGYDGRDSTDGGDITDYRGRGFLTVASGQTAANANTLTNGSNADSLHIHDPLSATITDPGDAGAIPVDKSGTCLLETSAAETRTLADPPVVGRIISLAFKTDGGDCVITAASAVNQAGNNTLTFNDAGDHIILAAIEVGSNLRWRVLCNDGVSLSTS